MRELIDDYRDKIMVGLVVSTQKGYGRNLIRIESRLGAYMATQVMPSWLTIDNGGN